MKNSSLKNWKLKKNIYKSFPTPLTQKLPIRSVAGLVNLRTKKSCSWKMMKIILKEEKLHLPQVLHQFHTNAQLETRSLSEFYDLIHEVKADETIYFAFFFLQEKI